MRATEARRLAAFEGRFDLCIAQTVAEIEACQRVRFQVYCIERGWWTEVQTHEAREFDEYDVRASHALLREKVTLNPVGTVRLILPSGDPDDPRLPLQTMCELRDAPDRLPYQRLGEVSRFSISRQWIRSSARSAHNDSRDATGLARYFSVGLMRGVVLMSRRHDITHLCAAMEPALLALLLRFGIRFTPLGEPKNYHGLRQPCYCDLAEVDAEMKKLCPEVHPTVFGA